MTERRGKRLAGFIVILPLLFTVRGIALSGRCLHTGVVVGLEPKIVRARGKDGTISVFWVGRKTQWKWGRVPHIGEKVRIQYVKDRLHRNAVIELTIIEE